VLRVVRAVWPWLALATCATVAVWYVVDFPNDMDPEFPTVVRPTFSPMPPAAYRIAEPGDTLDHLALYFSAWGVGIAGMSWFASRRQSGRDGLWPAALALALASTWYAATPGPVFDGWHGLGWRSFFDPMTPIVVKLSLGLGGVALVGLALTSIARDRREASHYVHATRRRGALAFLVLAAVLVPLRQLEIPGVAPAGYWPRWAFVVGILAFDLGLWRLRPEVRWRGRDLAVRLTAIAGMMTLVWGGLWVSWFHRPIERLKSIVPGRIYISAMPSPEGLAIAHGRHRFKTIINLFPEDLDEHPNYSAERQFADDHGIAYFLNDSDPEKADEILDQSLKIADDPGAWPVLVHCHACMDRTPAWLGIYRFVAQKRPLLEVMREIEQHRGMRPKASVFLLYNWNLPRLAPERHAQDPTAQLLLECSQHQRLAPSAYMRIAGDTKRK
jgi:hypothetical protein